jgi:hypothetical protein
MGSTMSDDGWIDIDAFDAETLTLQYGCHAGKDGQYTLKIIDHHTQGILHQEVVALAGGQRVSTQFGYCKPWIYDAVTVVFEVEGHRLVEQPYGVHTTPPYEACVAFAWEQDVEVSS